MSCACNGTQSFRLIPEIESSFDPGQVNIPEAAQLGMSEEWNEGVLIPVGESVPSGEDAPFPQLEAENLEWDMPAIQNEVAFAPVRLSRRGIGYAGFGGGCFDTALRNLRQLRRLQISDNDIEVLQRIANSESGGYATAVNTWDRAVVSIGFNQCALGPGILQNIIRAAPAGFGKYGIQIDSQRTYSFSHGGRQWRVPAIAGVANPESLRSEEWSRRFLLASAEPDVLAAVVQQGISRLLNGPDQIFLQRSSWQLPRNWRRARAMMGKIANGGNVRWIQMVVDEILRSTHGQVSAMNEDQFILAATPAILRVYCRVKKTDGPPRKWIPVVTHSGACRIGGAGPWATYRNPGISTRCR